MLKKKPAPSPFLKREIILPGPILSDYEAPNKGYRVASPLFDAPISTPYDIFARLTNYDSCLDISGSDNFKYIFLVFFFSQIKK